MHAPDLKREMDKIIRQDILGPVVRSAKANVPQDAPLSNWNRGVNAGVTPLVFSLWPTLGLCAA
jgi:hypothetical protein